MHSHSIPKLHAAAAKVAQGLGRDAADAVFAAPGKATATAKNAPESRGLSRNVATGEHQSSRTNPRPSTRLRRLEPRQLTAINLLVGGHCVAGAARALGINPRTIFRWMKDPRFLAEIDRRTAPGAGRGGRGSEDARGLAAWPRRLNEAVVDEVEEFVDDDDLDPEQVRRDMEFINSIAAESEERYWREREAMSRNLQKSSEMSRNVAVENHEMQKRTHPS